MKVGRLVKLAVCGPSMGRRKANNWSVAPVEAEDGLRLGMCEGEDTARHKD
jgi:hypothetical protein